MSNSYYDEYIDSNELPQSSEEDLPTWVSDKNSSMAAYRAIQTLYLQKRKYIKRHGMQSDYTKKSNFLIKKSEVALIARVNPQPLFHSNSYSAQLSAHLKNINERLEYQKNKRITQKPGGLRSKNKEQLVKEIQEQNNINAKTLAEVVDAAYERTLINVPLDIRTKLKITI
ncbi:hypothetical protein [Litorivivens sp.]|uniref:hypothetical protein n=1 Tax=Litorivivens sp. TaxID=2020868 RepID=UPI0035670734